MKHEWKNLMKLSHDELNAIETELKEKIWEAEKERLRKAAHILWLQERLAEKLK